MLMPSMPAGLSFQPNHAMLFVELAPHKSMRPTQPVAVGVRIGELFRVSKRSNAPTNRVIVSPTPCFLRHVQVSNNALAESLRMVADGLHVVHPAVPELRIAERKPAILHVVGPHDGPVGFIYLPEILDHLASAMRHNRVRVIYELEDSVVMIAERPMCWPISLQPSNPGVEVVRYARRFILGALCACPECREIMHVSEVDPNLWFVSLAEAD
jgi:hypothetical protein